jgi:hypothetical protein
VSGDGAANSAYYRILLASYPRHWRQSLRTQEILAVLLDAADADGRNRPTRAEAVNLVLNGLHARLLTASSVSRGVRNRIAQLALVTGSSLAITLLVLGEIGTPTANPAFPGLDTPVANEGDVGTLLASRFGPFQTYGVVVFAGWLLLLAAASSGRTVLSRHVAAATFGVTILLPRVARLTHHQRPPYSLLIGLALLAAAVAVMPERTSRASRLAVLGTVAVVSSSLIAWRIWALGALPAASPLRARSCFYWCPYGPARSVAYANGTPRIGSYGGADTLAQRALPVIALAILLAVAVWHWDRTWLAAVAVVCLPWLAIALRHSAWPWMPYYDRGLGMPPPRLSLIVGLWLLIAAGAVVLARQRRPPAHDIAGNHGLRARS